MHDNDLQKLEKELQEVKESQKVLVERQGQLLDKMRELDPWIDNMKNIKAAGKVGKVLFKILWWIIGGAASIASIVAAYYATKGQ